jgi:ribosomal protein S18 acetylase RimI-like enzyme
MYGTISSTMNIEFKKAILPLELRGLIAFDHKVFPHADWFLKADRSSYESYWLIVNGRKVGCCAFEHNVDFREDCDEEAPPKRGSLYIATTGILKPFRGKGFGDLFKCWQVTYARYYGCNRLVTNSRKSNTAMIGLNKKFGFKILRISKDKYYSAPPEPTVVMELKLRGNARQRSK